MYRRSFPLMLFAALLALGLAGPSLTTAQDASASLEGITVIGYGKASIPAETATVQFSIVDYNYVPTAQPPDTAQGRAVIEPVIAQLLAIGIPEESMEIILGPRLVELTKYEGPALALVRIAVDAPTTDHIAEILAAANTGAAAARLSVGTSGVSYGVADCRALERMARQAAIDDAGERAKLQADLLGTELGDVIASRDLPVEPGTVTGPYGPIVVQDACSPAVPVATFGTQNLPPFDPTTDTDVTVYAQIELTYEIAFGFGATPAP
jgi:uncharacterized protein YggE